MKAINILWDVDNEVDINFLPKGMEIPQEVIDEAEDESELLDLVSDYLSDETGFCHYGFHLEKD